MPTNLSGPGKVDIQEGAELREMLTSQSVAERRRCSSPRITSVLSLPPICMRPLKAAQSQGVSNWWGMSEI